MTVTTSNDLELDQRLGTNYDDIIKIKSDETDMLNDDISDLKLHILEDWWCFL